MDLDQLKTIVIQQTLIPLKLWCPRSENLLCATAAMETQGGKYIKQIGGPALGIYQMEPTTHDNLWRHKLSQPKNLPLVRAMLNQFGFARAPNSTVLMWHLGYATFMARYFYFIIPEELPAEDDLKGQWSYYKMYWNTKSGKATEQQFYRNAGDYLYPKRKRNEKNTASIIST